MTDTPRWFPSLAHASLANAVTLLNAALGIAGIVCAARSHPALALTCGAFALPCDVLDGYLARKLGTASAFGAQLDSLADATSFCLLPALIPLSMKAPWWVMPFAGFYALMGLVRLARFAVVGTSSAGDNERFEGVPTTFAAAMWQGAAAVALWLPRATRGPWIAAYFAVAGAAMVSSLPFPKRGWAARAMYVLVPAALASVWLRAMD